MPDGAPQPAAARASLWDYWRLMRISNVFTAVADVAMGFLFVHASLAPVSVLICLAAASCLLYTAGMVLNDLFDVRLDRRERPERPLASGRISLAAARRLGFGLLAGGLVCGWAAGYLPETEADLPWRSGAVATVLAALILLYDALLKPTPLGPLAMGSCRLLNVLLGMSVGGAFSGWNLVGFGPHQLTAAAGIGIYITGVTWLARSEAHRSQRWQLALATAVMAGGVAVLGLVHRAILRWEPQPLTLQESLWWLLLVLLAVPIVRRCGRAIAAPHPQNVQWAVRHALWSLIMLDAAVVLLLRELYALAVLALLIPPAILGRWIAST